MPGAYHVHHRCHSLYSEIEVVFSAYPLTWFISSVIFLIYFLKADWLHNFDRLEAKQQASRLTIHAVK